jgi:alanyl-tRNA synthetase
LKDADAFKTVAKLGETIGCVLDATNFYAEAGGQVYDTGLLETPSGCLQVDNVQAKGFVLHVGTVVSGEVKVGDAVKCTVDMDRRALIAPNHTTTHVLNMALRSVLGDGVDQKGSMVVPERLRFDFSSNAPAADAIIKVEAITKRTIEANLPVFVQTCALADARKIKTLRQVFGEHYPDPVRVVSIGVPVSDLLADPENPKWQEFSVEFCGGTHLDTLGRARTFVLVDESGIAKGVRRITGLTGPAAESAILLAEDLAQQVQAVEDSPDSELETKLKSIVKVVDSAEISYTVKHALRLKLEAITKRVKEYNKRVAAEKQDAATSAVTEAVKAALSAGQKFVVVVVDIGLDASIATKVYQNAKKAAGGIVPLMLISPSPKDGRVLCIAQSDEAGVDSVKWVMHTVVAVLEDGAQAKGGGRPACASAQGTQLDKVDAAYAKAIEFARSL